MAVITGTISNDVIAPFFVTPGVVGGPSTAAADVIQGIGGNDFIDGGNGADDIFGGDGNDTLLGGTGAESVGGFNDLLDGGTGNDSIDGGDGADQIVGGTGSDTLRGGVGFSNDTLLGQDDNDTLFGAAGGDLLDGGNGSDTADYASLGAAITLRSQGVIAKAGSLGTDTIAGVETIVGAVGLANLIDGDVAGPQTTSFQVDLQALTLTVNGIPALGSANFRVVNFRDVRGTDNADAIRGDAADNTFLGTTGSDAYDGRTGFDTIDYTGIAAPVTLLAQGVIAKGALGTDTIANMERIVGAAGFANLIDGRIVGPQTTSFVVDLAAESLTVNGIPVLGSTSFEVESFVNVAGTANADNIRGNALGNLFLGTAGSDAYDGVGGVDTIDYSGLGGAVTLLSQGVIAKGALGTDTIANMERIVGAAGFANTIDGTVAAPATQTTSFFINLATNSLTVNGIPFLGTANFSVFNFGRVVGTNNLDVILGDAGNNTLEGAGGDDILRGGAGDDSMIGGAGGDLMDGGAGFDSISYSNAAARVTINLNDLTTNTGDAAGDGYSGIEEIFGSSFNDRLTGDANNNGLFGATGNDTLNGGAGNDTVGGGSGDDNVTGGNGNDSLIGAADNDTLDGSGGNDTLTGGLGTDVLTGGTGGDVFAFNTRNEGLDIVNDFNTVQDLIQVSSGGFGGVLPLGALAANRFAANAGGTATLAQAQFVYNTTTGQLGFDQDGTGGGGISQLAILLGVPGLTAADFVVVA